MSCLSSTVFIFFINHLWAKIADACCAHGPRSPRESAPSLADLVFFQLVRLESNSAGVAWSLGCTLILCSCPDPTRISSPGIRHDTSAYGLSEGWRAQHGRGCVFPQPHILPSAGVISQSIFQTKLPPARFWSLKQAEISAGKIDFTALTLSFHIHGPPAKKSSGCSTKTLSRVCFSD